MSSPVVSALPVGGALARYVSALSVGRGDPLAAEAYAAAKGWLQTASVLRGVITALGQGDVASALKPITFDLAAALRPMTVVGRLAGMRPVPFATRVLRQSLGATGTWVGEQTPIPVSKSSFDVVAALNARKVAAISVVTSELLQNAEPASYSTIAADVLAAVAEALDRAFLDPSNHGDATTPASVTAGATSFESSGSSLANVDADLGRLVGALTDANCSLQTAAWTMSARTACSLARLRGTGGAAAYPGVTARGGILLGIPVLTSANTAVEGSPGEGMIALIEGSEVLIADEGEGSIDLSNEAALQLSDGPSAGAQQLVSLWQAGMVGLRSSRVVNWTIRRATSAAVLRSVAF